MFNLRGIEISRDRGDKFVKLIVQVDYSDIYKTVRRKANVPITRELIMAQATGHYGIDPADIVWPHHVKVLDVE